MSDYTAKRIDDMDAIYGGAFKRARAELGVTSFGFQVIDLPPEFELYPDHDHAADGQEEVYVALRGSGTIQVAGDSVPFDSETMVRVAPNVKRKVLPGPDGLRILVLGGVPGGVYTPKATTEVGAPAPALGTPVA